MWTQLKQLKFKLATKLNLKLDTAPMCLTTIWLYRCDMQNVHHAPQKNGETLLALLLCVTFKSDVCFWVKVKGRGFCCCFSFGGGDVSTETLHVADTAFDATVWCRSTSTWSSNAVQWNSLTRISPAKNSEEKLLIVAALTLLEDAYGWFSRKSNNWDTDFKHTSSVHPKSSFNILIITE